MMQARAGQARAKGNLKGRNGTFINKISDEAGSYKKCKQVEERVDLRTKTNVSQC